MNPDMDKKPEVVADLMATALRQRRNYCQLLCFDLLSAAYCGYFAVAGFRLHFKHAALAWFFGSAQISMTLLSFFLAWGSWRRAQRHTVIIRHLRRWAEAMDAQHYGLASVEYDQCHAAIVALNKRPWWK